MGVVKPDASVDADIRSRILAWLKGQVEKANRAEHLMLVFVDGRLKAIPNPTPRLLGEPVELLSAQPDGSDWAGDTEGGFYPEFSMRLTWRDSSGAEQYLHVEGKDMASLWMAVVSEESR